MVLLYLSVVVQENIKMVNSYYYDGNQYIPRTQGDSSKGFILASLASSAIMGTLPAFSKPFSSQLIKEHSQNDLYKDAFEQSINISGLDKKGVQIIPAQFLRDKSDVCCGQNAYYMPKTKQIVINTDKISIAGFHEAGHALNDLKGKWGKLLSKMRWPGRAVAGFMGYVALFQRTKPKEAPKDKMDFIKDNCGKIAFLSMLPTVFEEGMASYKGVKLAKKTGLAEPLIKNMKKLYAKALLTYVGHATATGLAVGAASVIMDYFSRPKKVQMEEGFWY